MPLTKMAQVGIKAALMAGSMAMTMTQKIKGPRLKSTDVTTADFGTPLERFWGKRRLLGRPIIHAEKLREKKSTSKTKGGKYAEYKYFGTFAVAVADHEIDSVSRIWMDKHIVYDVSGAGPISIGGMFLGLTGAPVKLTRGRNMRIYLGTESQGIDPRYESWCEDRYGPNTATAYRGVSYIFFENIPLEKFGNRIPQVDVEAINNDTDSFPFETLDPVGPYAAISKDHQRILFWGSGTTLEVYDLATRSRIINTSFQVTPHAIEYASDGSVWGNGGTLGSLLRKFSESGAVLAEIPTGAFTDDVFACGGKIFLHLTGGDLGILFHNPGAQSCDFLTTSFAVSRYFEDLDGNAWALGISGTTLYLYDVEGQSEHSLGTPGGVSAGVGGFVNPDGNFFIIIGTTVCVIDKDTFAVLDSAVIAGLSSDSINTAKYSVPGTALFWGDEKEIDTRTLEVTRTITLSDWTSANTSEQVYLLPLHALLGTTAATTFTIRYLDRVGSDGVDLGDVVSDVAEWCGIETVDVSDLDQVVQGYSVVQGTGKDMIAPLLDIHDVDARPHDFGVQFLTRGDASLGTIQVSEFVREGDEPRYRITIAQDTDLPRQISLSFADQNNDQQTNTVVAQRPLDAVDSVRTQQIDLTTYVGTPGDMQKVLDRYFRAQWNRREKVDNGLTAQYLAVEPADVYTLQLDGVTWTGKVEKVTLTQGRLNVEWARDETGLHTLGSGTGAGLDARDPDEIFVPSPTKGFVKDIPLTEDAHDSDLPLLYYGAGDYGLGDWPGAVIFEGDTDGDDYLAWKGVEAADKATWGFANETLADANPNLWDRGNSLSVSSNVALTTVTEAEIDADPTLNLALVGDELLNFTTATLEGDGSYTLSGFKRGRRGTEWACPDHEAGEEFVLISTLDQDGLGLSDVGLDLFYKAQTVGRDVSVAEVIEVDFAGNSLKPYAPASLKWVFDGTDLLGTITRRTRIGGAWVGSTTIPLSEASEEYEVEIYNGATLKRTISVSGTNTFTYTAAMAAADSITLPTPPTSITYQLSDAVGRGFALAA